MLASIDKDGNFTSIFKKQLVEIDDKIRDIFPDIERFVNTKPSTKEWNDWVNKLEGADDSLKDFLKTKDEAYQTKDLATYTKYLKDQNKLIDIQTIKTKALNVVKKMSINIVFAAAATLVSKGIELAAKAIDNYAHRVEKAKETVSKITEEIDDLNDKLKTTQSTIKESAQRFSELYQGINPLTGQNKSLNTKDYEEFLDLSNQIAELFPELPVIFTENGDAIVQLSGDVDSLVSSLKDLLKLQRQTTNQEIVDKLPNLFKNIKTISSGYMEEIDNIKTEIDNLSYIYTDEFSKSIQEGLDNGYFSFESWSSEENPDKYNSLLKIYRELFKKLNINYNESLGGTYEYDDTGHLRFKSYASYSFVSDEEIENAKKHLSEAISKLGDEYQEDIDELNKRIIEINKNNKLSWSSLRSSIFAWMSTDDVYSIMDNETQSIMQNIINNFDFEDLDFKNWEEAKKYIKDHIFSLYEDPNQREKISSIETMLEFKTQFNNNEITVGQYQEYLQNFLDSIEDLPPETKKSVLLLFGIQTNDDGTTTSDTDAIVENVKNKLKGTEFDDMVGKLDSYELEIAANLEIDNDSVSWNELLALIEEEKNKIALDSFDFLNISSTVDQLNTRLKPAMDSLKSSWEEIFTEDGFALEDIDLLSTVSTIKSKLDELNNISGITLDYSSFDNFVRILEDTKSTEDDVKQGFNELAQSIVQAAVSGIEDFETLKIVLGDLGVVNNDIIAFQALIQNENALKKAGLDVYEATESEIESFVRKRVSIENVSVAIENLNNMILFYKKQKSFRESDLNRMDTAEEVNNLRTLAEQCGVTGEIIADLTELEQLYQDIANGVYGTNNRMHLMALERISELRKKIEKEKLEFDIAPPEINFETPEVEYDPKIDKSSAKKSADELEKLTKDYIDSYLTYMEQSLETGRIDYHTYSRDVAKFLKDMYDQGKIAAKDYHDYTKQMLEVQKEVKLCLAS